LRPGTWCIFVTFVPYPVDLALAPEPEVDPMLKRTLALVLLTAVLAVPALANDLIAHTWSEALALSKAHDKPVLIDFFTEW
jgi:hypothetical protein